MIAEHQLFKKLRVELESTTLHAKAIFKHIQKKCPFAQKHPDTGYDNWFVCKNPEHPKYSGVFSPNCGYKSCPHGE